RDQAFRGREEMLPVGARGAELPEVGPPARWAALVPLAGLLAAHRGKVQAAVFPFDDPGLDLLLGLTLTRETSPPELRDHVSAIDESPGIGEVFHQTCGGGGRLGLLVGVVGGDAEPDVSPRVAAGGPPDRMGAGEVGDRDQAEFRWRVGIAGRRAE